MDPYRHQQFGFTTTRGGSDCRAIRYAVWERTCRAGWCVSEQFWDVVKAFDMLRRPQLSQDIQATTVWVLVALRSLYNRARMFVARLWFLTCTGVKRPGLFCGSYDAGVAEWHEDLNQHQWAEMSLATRGNADDLAITESSMILTRCVSTGAARGEWKVPERRVTSARCLNHRGHNDDRACGSVRCGPYSVYAQYAKYYRKGEPLHFQRVVF